MKLTFPCKEYDSEKDGNIWCQKLMNKEYCDNAAKCMALTEKEICDVMNTPKKIITNQIETKEILVKELDIRELQRVI